MASELLIDQKQEGSVTRFVLSGKIDEASDYSMITSSKASHIVLDFNGISLINSSGIQRWIQFLKSLPASTNVDFDNCPLRIVNQMNLFPAFLADRNIVPLNFYAPYYCEKCDASKNIKLCTSTAFADRKNIVAPPMSCPDCKSAMEFDGLEKKYFIFLQRSA